jgi:leucyl/phenylalanyl-tRNA--protein transferase
MRLAWLGAGDPLPDPTNALSDPPGLLAAGLDLSPRRLREAYGRGIFPWYSVGQPVLWWSPDPRMVLFPREFRCSRSLRQTLRRALERAQWQLTLDRAFERVMRACAEPRADQDGTWITEEIVQAYVGLHRSGLAHSVEVWGANQQLLAGLYGVALGRVFFGESMFTRVRDGSKAALAVLIDQLRAWEFALIDCQQETQHLASLGARPIPRDQFLHILSQATPLPAPDWASTVLNPILS